MLARWSSTTDPWLRCLFVSFSSSRRPSGSRRSECWKEPGPQVCEQRMPSTERSVRVASMAAAPLSSVRRSATSPTTRQVSARTTNTKVFLRNSDREVDYAASFLGDGRQIIRLTPGRAIVHNSAWGAVTVQVRPPLSKVWELSERDALSPRSTRSIPRTRALAGRHRARRSFPRLARTARKVS